MRTRGKYGIVVDIQDMTQGILRLSDQAAHMSQILAVALSNGRSVRELQSEAKDSMADLVKTVAQLSDTTHIELDRINGSAYLIQQYLEIQRYQSIWPWKNWLIKAFGFIYSGNYEVFDRWVSL